MNLEEMKAKRVVYSLPGMEATAVTKDLVYKQTDEGDLKFDVYYPPHAQPGERHPAVVFVHGDANPEILKDAKDWGQYVSWGQLVAASGMAAVTFNHRSTINGAALPEVIRDIKDLLAHIRANSGELNLDTDNLCIWVCSAGGPSGLYAAMKDLDPSIKGLLSLYAIMDLKHVKDSLPRLAYDEYCPSNYIAPGLPPMLVVRCGNDWEFLNRSVDSFVSKALECNLEIELLNHAEGQHAFDILDDCQRSRDIIKRVLWFMQSCLIRQ